VASPTRSGAAGGGFGHNSAAIMRSDGCTYLGVVGLASLAKSLRAFKLLSSSSSTQHGLSAGAEAAYGRCD
jgi:hypothetical protein